MPIENRNLTKGTKLTGRYHKQTYSCEVVEDCGRETALPSGGWTGIQEPFGCRHGHHRTFLRRLEILECVTEENAAAPKAENQEAVPAAEPTNCRACGAAKTDPKKTGVFLVPNQKGVPEGQIRWFCRDCGKSFIASAVEVPGVCPNHQAS